MDQQNSIWRRRLHWGLSVGELAAVLLLYIVFATFYYGALYITSIPMGGFTRWEQVALYYTIILLVTIPVWYLLFRRLRHWPLRYRLPLHLVLLPAFAFGFRFVFYRIGDLLGVGHLAEEASFWDIYIPSLFYCLQFGIFHSYDYYRRFKDEQLLQAELRELALQNELTALKAQINPHFLYNVFNTISASIPPAQEQTREMIAKLSDMFRYQLQASRREWVRVGEEVDFVRKYLELEKERFGDRLQYRFRLDPEAADRPMPPLLLQPLVENAVKHGIAPLIEGGSIDINITTGAKGVQCSVRDTGVGLAGRSPEELFDHGIGLTNTQLRLEKMFGTGLVIEENAPRGFVVSFATG